MDREICVVKLYLETNGYFAAPWIELPGQNTNHMEVAYKSSLPTTFDEPPHYHPKGEEICIVLEGSWTFKCEDESIVTIKAGEASIIQPGVQIQNISSEPGTRMIVIKAPAIPNDKVDVHN